MNSMPLPSPDDALNAWLAALAAPTASPAGGSAAAIAGALAAALVQMVAGMTATREKYRAVHGEATEVAVRAGRLREWLAALAARDAEVFGAFTAALALPSGTVDARSEREAAKAGALRAGAGVQVELLARLVEVTDLAEAMAERGLASAVGDAATAVFLAAGAARSACWAVRGNLQGVADGEAGRRQLAEATASLERIEAAAERVRRLLEERAG